MELPGITTPTEVCTPVSAATPPAAWSPALRMGFRIAFLYFFCFIFLGANGTLLGAVPVAGGWIQDKLKWPFNHLSEFTGQHLFHLTGIAAHWHPSESGDTTMNWIHTGLLLAFALAGGILWTLIDLLRNNPRTEYRTLHAWLRFFLRLTCGMFMIGYGLAKVFPFQMPPPSIAVLNEPAGNMAPMTFLWNLIGLNPVYEIICGSAEVLGGVLLLYRRTSLAGALFSTFVVTNVVLYNFCYDVPVKLFAVDLLLGCIFLALPDAHSVCRFLWSHKPAAPTATWIPPAGRRAGRIAILVTEIVFAVLFLVVQPIFMTIGWRHLQAALRTPSPMVGAWRLDAAHRASGAFIDPEGVPITDLYVAASNRAYTRSTDGELWLSIFDPDPRNAPSASAATSSNRPPITPGSSRIPTTSFSPRSHPNHPNPAPSTSPPNRPRPSSPPSSPSPEPRRPSIIRFSSAASTSSANGAMSVDLHEER